MVSSLLSLLHWCSNTRTIVFIRDSSFGMPAVQSVHLIGLTVLLAAILVMNLRLAALSMMDWSLPAVERQLRPWALGAFTLMVVSGTLMFLGNPMKYLASGPFLFKMTALCLAALCQFGVLRRFFTSDPGLRPRSVNLTVAGLSLTLWFSVGWAGRAIAFV
jgi:hypothetical protein